MKSKPVLIAAALILLVTAVAIGLMNSNKSATDEGGSPGGGSGSGVASDGSASGQFKTASAKPGGKRSERELKDAELAEKYGESRTNLSRHVAKNVASLFDDVISMGEMMSEGGGFGGPNMGARMALRGIDVELNEEQNQQVADLYKQYQKRELERTRSAVESLKENPAPLMGLILASDARSREELSEEEYAQLQAASADELKGIVNPLDRNNFRGGQPMQDEEFRSQFVAILDEDQITSFEETMKERDAKPDGGQTSITEIPVMDLEKFDQSISSAKQMTGGFKQMMEGMGSLRELRPMEQPDGESQGGGDAAE